MLQQILRDMYVDPEILVELDDNQKQTLFCKMREEQVRRWRTWNEKLGEELMKPQNNKNMKTVGFLNGIDGEPWVWVMGEHENDKSIDDILKEEAINKARKMAKKETEELIKQAEAHFVDTRDVLQELTLNTQKVAQRVALWEKRLTDERTCEIFQKMQKKHQELAKEAEEEEKRKEQLWREQEEREKYRDDDFTNNLTPCYDITHEIN
ncbi:hypothetical protein NQ314_008764 [Rhamnusium bicolor]|uniref:SH3 domain-containing protein n=1 Tax=Rhamnusium bicolor TaxID=1586634 RepID=A0AAV8Y654_9CUCU|nr:hypothetical protein NQ314_008764 [Rhamnusium bicolor]